MILLHNPYYFQVYKYCVIRFINFYLNSVLPNGEFYSAVVVWFHAAWSQTIFHSCFRVRFT